MRYFRLDYFFGNPDKVKNGTNSQMLHYYVMMNTILMNVNLCDLQRNFRQIVYFKYSHVIMIFNQQN